ncbi:MAG: hypothetical protein Q8Q18_00490 [bacterium]|nr:hypothetical protein [bacterium]
MAVICHNGVMGISTGTWISPEIHKLYAEHVKSRSIKFGFLDLAFSDHIANLIVSLLEQGHEIGLYADHHVDPNLREEYSNIVALEHEITTKYARFIPRRDCKASALLVKEGEFIEENIELVFFHEDFDGFVSFLKGCGITWPSMTRDATIIDSACTGVLSAQGKLLLEQMKCFLPNARVDPTGRERILERVYKFTIQWIANGCNAQSARKMLRKIERQKKKTLSVARKAAETAKELNSFLAYVDMSPYIREDPLVKVSDISMYIKERLGPKKIIAVEHSDRESRIHVVEIHIPKYLLGMFNLHELLPASVRRSTRFRANVSTYDFPIFLHNMNNLIEKFKL